MNLSHTPRISLASLSRSFDTFVLNWKRIQPILAPYLVPFCVLSLITFTVQLLGLALPFLVSQVACGFERGTQGRLYWYVGAIVAVSGAIVLLGQVHWNQYYKRVGAPIQKDVDLAILKKMSSLSLGQIEDDAETLRETAQAGSAAMCDCIDLVAKQFVPVLASLFLTVAWILCLNVWVGLIALLGFAAFSTVTWNVVRNFMPRIRDFTNKDASFRTRFWERVANMSNVIMMGQQEAEVAKCAAEYREGIVLGRKLWGGYQASLALAREPVSLLSFVALLVVSMFLERNGTLSPASFVAIMWWSLSMFLAINALTTPLRDLLEGWGRISKLIEFLEMLPRAVSLPNLVRPKEFTGISFRKVSFTHFSERCPGGKQTLHNVTFDINPGELVALVGPSGSGKTTSMSQIIGSYFPTTGGVFVSRTNIKRLDLDWWHDRVGYVPQGQRLRLWNATMRQNILYGRQGVPEGRFISSLKAARLYDSFYENGLVDSKKLGENGCNLSGGERQRVAIARALVGMPSVLLFDEPMTGLDNENEAAILDSILDLAKGGISEFGPVKYTIVVVAHKIITACQADKVIVFDKGRVVGIGKHAKLIESCPVYARLAWLESKNSKLDENPQVERVA